MNERRQHCRVSGTMVRNTTVRVRPGHDATVLNLCPRGALIELRRPMAPGIHVDLQISEENARITVRALVLRCTVRTIAALEGVTYQAALLFDERSTPARAVGAPNGYVVPDASRVIGDAGESVLPNRDDAYLPIGQETAK